MSQKQFSIIVPAGRLEKAMVNVRNWISDPVRDFEILIVTPNPPSEPVLDDRVRCVITGKLFPPGAMRNRGAQSAESDFYIFCDDDVEVDINDIRKLVKKLQTDERLSALNCRVCAPYSFLAHCADYCLFRCYQGFSAAENVGLGSALLVVRKECFKAVNGFDEELLACEDIDFSLKLTKKGFTTYFTPTVQATHWHGRASVGGILKCAYYYGKKSGIIIQLRHPELVSPQARLNALLKGPIWSLLKILPGSVLYCIQTCRMALPQDPVVLLFLPIVFFSRASFLYGIAQNLKESDRFTRTKDSSIAHT